MGFSDLLPLTGLKLPLPSYIVGIWRRSSRLPAVLVQLVITRLFLLSLDFLNCLPLDPLPIHLEIQIKQISQQISDTKALLGKRILEPPVKDGLKGDESESLEAPEHEYARVRRPSWGGNGL